jgi:hypothetical protein
MVRAVGNSVETSKNREHSFTIASATSMLPLIRRITSEMAVLRDSIRAQRSQIKGIDGIRQTIPLADYQEEIRDIRSTLEADEKHWQSCVKELDTLGVCSPWQQDLDATLIGIDFPGSLNRRSVCFCWVPGDATVAFWHEVDEPCAARRPIDPSMSH